MARIPEGSALNSFWFRKTYLALGGSMHCTWGHECETHAVIMAEPRCVGGSRGSDSRQQWWRLLQLSLITDTLLPPLTSPLNFCPLYKFCGLDDMALQAVYLTPLVLAILIHRYTLLYELHDFSLFCGKFCCDIKSCSLHTIRAWVGNYFGWQAA